MKFAFIYTGSPDGVAESLESSFIELSMAARVLLTEVVQHSTSHSSSNADFSSNKESVRRTSSMPRNDAFLWGSNSSHQLVSYL